MVFKAEKSLFLHDVNLKNSCVTRNSLLINSIYLMCRSVFLQYYYFYMGLFFT